MGCIVAREAKPELNALPWRDCEAVPARHLRPVLRGVYCRRPRDDVIVDAILREWRSSGDPEQARHVCVVLAEKEVREASSAIAIAGSSGPAQATLIDGR